MRCRAAIALPVLALTVLALEAAGQAPATAEGTSALRLSPALIEMGTFYDGAHLGLEGVAAAGTRGVVVVIRGAEIEETFNRKARAGPIWVNSGKVLVSGVPSRFFAFGTGPVTDFLPRETIDRLQLDETAVKAQMRVEPAEQDQEVIRTSYLKLKSNQGVYQTHDDLLRLGPEGPGGRPFSLAFDWPKTAPAGEYEVRAYECKDGAVIRESHARLEVVRMGFPARMADLARERARLYGAMAVLIALLAGLGIDFVASRLGKPGAVGH